MGSMCMVPGFVEQTRYVRHTQLFRLRPISVLLDTAERVLVLTASTNQEWDHEPRPCSEHLNRVPDS